MTNAPANGGQGAAALAPASTANAQPAEWTAGLDDAAKGYISNKGWKSPADLFQSYQNLEKMRGVPAERLLTLPEGDDPEAWGQVWARLGRPEKPEDYGLQAPEGGSPETVAALAKMMHEAGIPKAQAQKLAAAMQASGTEMQTAAQQAAAQKSEAEFADVRKEWGAAFDAKAEMGRRYARELGLTQDDLAAMESALGTGKLLRLMAKGGERLGEHAAAGLDGGGKGMGVMTPEAAKSRISALHNDPDWSKRYLAGGANENAEMQQLIKYANGLA